MWIVNQDGFFSWTLGDPEKYKKLYMPKEYVVVRARDEVSLIRMRDRIIAAECGYIMSEPPFNMNPFEHDAHHVSVGEGMRDYDERYLIGTKARKQKFKSLQIEGAWDGDYKYRMAFHKNFLQKYFTHYVQNIEYTSFKGAMHDLWTAHYVQPMAGWKLDSLLDIWATIKHTWVSTRVEDWRKLDIQ